MAHTHVISCMSPSSRKVSDLQGDLQVPLLQLKITKANLYGTLTPCQTLGLTSNYTHFTDEVTEAQRS